MIHLPAVGKLHKGSTYAAGLDLATPVPIHIYPGTSEVVDLEVAVAIPNGYYGLLTHRSSLAFKRDCIISTGVIDSDYRGSISIKMFNLGKDIQHFEAGDRIAQMIIQRYADVVPIASDKLGDTARGEGGFGSTGV